jgi:hypothetical protein
MKYWILLLLIICGCKDAPFPVPPLPDKDDRIFLDHENGVFSIEGFAQTNRNISSGETLSRFIKEYPDKEIISFSVISNYPYGIVILTKDKNN